MLSSCTVYVVTVLRFGGLRVDDSDAFFDIVILCRKLIVRGIVSAQVGCRKKIVRVCIILVQSVCFDCKLLVFERENCVGSVQLACVIV